MGSVSVIQKLDLPCSVAVPNVENCEWLSGFPQGLENWENREKIMVREKSGKSQGILFWAKSQGKVREFCFKLPIAMKICCYSCRLSRMFVTVFTNMKVHMWILKKLYFSLFSSATSAALNTIQISYGISYFRHRDSSDIFTCDIARQSVVDKMVREISLEVREKSGKSQEFCFTFLWEPWLWFLCTYRIPLRYDTWLSLINLVINDCSFGNFVAENNSNCSNNKMLALPITTESHMSLVVIILQKCQNIPIQFLFCIYMPASMAERFEA